MITAALRTAFVSRTLSIACMAIVVNGNCIILWLHHRKLKLYKIHHSVAKLKELSFFCYSLEKRCESEFGKPQCNTDKGSSREKC